jgi:integrase
VLDGERQLAGRPLNTADGIIAATALEHRLTIVASSMTRKDVWYMVRRRVSGAGIETATGCHTFRATRITDRLTNGGRIEVAQLMGGHSNAKTTGLYDRRNDDISVVKVESGWIQAKLPW